MLNPTNLAKFNAVQLLQSDLVSRNVDIALIRETRFGVRHADDSASMKGFSLLRKDRFKRGCGGVCIYFRSCLDVTECIFPSALQHNLEIIWTNVPLKIKSTILLAVTTLPNLFTL